MTKSLYKAIADTTTVTTLVFKNTKRKELMLTNNSSSILYVAFTRLPSSTDWDVRLFPYDVLITEKIDKVSGVWSADTTSGQANTLEESND